MGHGYCNLETLIGWPCWWSLEDCAGEYLVKKQASLAVRQHGAGWRRTYNFYPLASAEESLDGFFFFFFPFEILSFYSGYSTKLIGGEKGGGGASVNASIVWKKTMNLH